MTERNSKHIEELVKKEIESRITIVSQRIKDLEYDIEKANQLIEVYETLLTDEQQRQAMRQMQDILCGDPRIVYIYKVRKAA